MALDGQQDGVGFLTPVQGLVQHFPAQLGQGLLHGAADEFLRMFIQDVVQHAVAPPDHALRINLQNPAEGEVQHRVHLGAGALLQVDGVGHTVGNSKGILQAFLPGGQEIVRQTQCFGTGADNIATNDRLAALLQGTVHQSRQAGGGVGFLGVRQGIAAQFHAE